MSFNQICERILRLKESLICIERNIASAGFDEDIDQMLNWKLGILIEIKDLTEKLDSAVS